MKVVFSGAASIEFQGKKVLEFIALFPSFVEYRLCGFNMPAFTIEDYRVSGQHAIANYLLKGNEKSFVKAFCKPCSVKIIEADAEKNYKIELRDSQSEIRKHVLWVAIGMPCELPNYQFKFRKIVFIGERHMGLCSVYQKIH